MIIYSLTTGAPLRKITSCGGLEEALVQANTGEGVADSSVDPEMHFVDVSMPGHPILPRQPIPYSLDTSTIDADGVDFATISNLPVTPVFITVLWPDGSRDTLAEDNCEFAVTVPGMYDIVLTSPIHLDTTVTLTAI